MTNELFRNDGYISKFEAQITAIDGDYVTLESTAFYPGGGGQICDTGKINDFNVTEVKYKNTEIVHKVPGHKFTIGDTVQCSVDWDRRYELMKGHTAEHLLFNALHRQDTDISIVKISISPEEKYVVIDRDISWDKISNAVEFVNEVIKENKNVFKTTVTKDDPDIENVRVNLDRIKGDLIDIIEIDGIDRAACCGTHVMGTSEIGALFVSKKTLAGNKGFEIHFKIGKDAITSSMKLATSCLSIIDIVGCKPESVVKTVTNVKKELELLKKQLKMSVTTSIKMLVPKIVCGCKIYSGIFPVSDKSVLIKAADSYKKEGDIAVFIGRENSLMVIMASGNPKIECKSICLDCIGMYGGHGGGSSDFAQGGVQDILVADDLLKNILSRIESSLE